MKTCPNCNNGLEDEALFCDVCGMKLPEEMKCEPEAEFVFCTNCGKKCAIDSAFCDECGASLTEKDSPVHENDTAYDSITKPKVAVKMPSLGKKMPLIGGLVAAVLIIFCIINFFVLPTLTKKAAIYMKDYEIFYTDFSGKPVQITKKFISREYVENNDFDWSYFCNRSNFISKNGKMVVYPDNINNGNGYYTTDIYLRNMKNKNAEPVKIARVAGLDFININDEGNLVTYKHGSNSSVSDGGLYQYDIKTEEKTKLDSSDYYGNINISEDGNIVYYLSQVTESESNLYLKERKKDKEKIDNNVSKLLILDDYQTVYYIKEDNLYKKQIGKEKVKLASDVSQLLKVYKEGVYYTKRKENTYNLSDFVNNDLEYGAPEGLMEEKITFDEYNVCYFDGKEENVLGKIEGEWGSAYSKNRPVAVFNIIPSGEMKVKMDLSVMENDYVNLYDFEAVKNNIKDALTHMQQDIECSVYEGKNLKGIISDKFVDQLSIDDDGNSIYFIGESSESGYGDLCEATAKGGYKPKIKDYQVYEIKNCVGGEAFYSKDRGDVSFTLYKDKKAIDEMLNYSLNLDGNAFTYVKDGDIYLYINGKKEKLGSAGKEVPVSDGVASGNFLFLADYNPKYKNGELYRYNKGKIEKLESDANYILGTNFAERSK